MTTELLIEKEVINRISQFKCTTAEDFHYGVDMLRLMRHYKEKLDEKFRPPVDAAWKAHQQSIKLYKEACAKVDDMIDVLSTEIKEFYTFTDDETLDSPFIQWATIYDIEVTDQNELMNYVIDNPEESAAIIPNTAYLKLKARQMGDLFNIPGVKLVKKQSLRVKSTEGG